MPNTKEVIFETQAHTDVIRKEKKKKAESPLVDIQHVTYVFFVFDVSKQNHLRKPSHTM